LRQAIAFGKTPKHRVVIGFAGRKAERSASGCIESKSRNREIDVKLLFVIEYRSRDTAVLPKERDQ
jgi:hypothetical protein